MAEDNDNNDNNDTPQSIMKDNMEEEENEVQKEEEKISEAGENGAEEMVKNDDSSSLPKSNTDDTTPESQQRTEAHNKLRSYESRRRTAYSVKLSSSSLYWRSFRELIHCSLRETERVERIVLARIAANEAYANAMEAIHEDILDSKYRPISDLKKKKRVQAVQKKKMEDDLLINGGSIGSDGKKKEYRSGDQIAFIEEGSKGPFLPILVESHTILAGRYNESAKNMKEQVAEEITGLRKQLEERVKVIEALGDAILEELQAAEKETVDAWGKYFINETKLLAGVGPKDNSQPPRLGVSTSNEEIIPRKDCSDVWIDEMHYRMAVAFLSACWEKCSAELSRLFSMMKDTECSRRVRLRELLINFLKEEENLWKSLPSMSTPVLNDIVDRPTDRPIIEEDVQNSIRLRAQYIQREEHATEKKSDTGSGLSSDLAKEGNFELSSPLMSNLLCNAKVVERKENGMMKSWKTVLAITTADSFLQLFEIPSHLKIHSGSASEVAFHAIVPPVEIPSEDNLKAISVAGEAPKLWNEILSPTDSLVLPNCKILFNDDGKNSAFEITETVFNSGVSKVLGKISVRKMSLRTTSYDETNEWISVLKAPSQAHLNS